MSIVKAVAKMRFKYHANMLDVVNAANQLGIMSDEKAEAANKFHVFNCIDCLERLGYDTRSLYVEQTEEES